MQLALGSGFAVERELPGAGESRVFVAQELALGRRIVVKMLPKALASGMNVDRFRREIAIAATLQHPHFVPLLSVGVAQSVGVPWFSMPFIEGESLRELLARRGMLPASTAVRLMREMASALAYAHARGIVHRDIKPDNVLLCDGVSMISDFGVAMAVDKALDVVEKRERITGADARLGTPSYSAPEQIESASTVDHRADLYSLGCVAYEMLTGAPPFAGTMRDVVRAQMNDVPAPIERSRSGLPAALSALVMRCLAKNPSERPQTASEIVKLVDDITSSSLHESTDTPVVTSPARPRAEAIRATRQALPSPSRWTIGPGARVVGATTLLLLLMAMMLLR